MNINVRASAPNPWHALWAMLVGFFMILVDATIVAVANPSIMDSLDTDYDSVIWVTSAYLLAYAVPLLLAGRLGDSFGPKNLYLAGLALFTLASLACGLAGSIGVLIGARVVQGLGAALLTPQTLSTITRLFPPERRGIAMSLWGATAGVATLIGPLAGGVLVDGLGWQWIFIVNVPIGIIGLGLAYWLVPNLGTEKHDFDLLGVVLSGAGIFLVVFALQEGETHDWALWIWGMILAGLAMMAGFVYWQSVNPNEPLIPLKIFRDNDFSLSNVGIAVIGFTVTAMVLPLLFYLQAVCGLSPTRSALVMAPMAIATGVLARSVGKLVDRAHPRPIVGFGFSMMAIALTWLSIEMTPTTPIWRLVLPLIATGVGMAFIWAPLAATATRNLPPAVAGAGSGVYNATRQVGSVLGSAGIAAFMSERISAEMPGGGDALNPQGSITQLPRFLHEPFSAALSQSLLLPAFVALFGVVAAIFLRGTGDAVVDAAPRRVAPTVDDAPDVLESFTAELRSSASRRPARAVAPTRGAYEKYPDDYPDDDDYVEYTVDWDDYDPHDSAPIEPTALDAEYEADDAPAIAMAIANAIDVEVEGDEGDTEPFPVHVSHPLHAPAETWHGGSAESWTHWVPDDLEDTVVASDAGLPAPQHAAAQNGYELDAGYQVRNGQEGRNGHELLNGHQPRQHVLDHLFGGAPPLQAEETDPIGIENNGFNVKPIRRARTSTPPPGSGGRHSRGDEDAGTYGKHSMPHGE